jgi:integrase
MKDKMISLDFQSRLASHIKGFLNEKHLLGYKYTRASYELQAFDRFCRDYDCVDNLPKELVLEWVQRKPHQKPQTVCHKIAVLSEFAKYMNRLGLEAYAVPAYIAPAQTKEHMPYIFNRQELSDIFIQADNLTYNPQSPIRHLVMPLMFRFLYCCGLRASEAIMLKIEDVNLETGIVHLKHTKEYLDRLIPLDAGLHQRFKAYRRELSVLGIRSEYFFPSSDGGHYHIFTIRNNFRKLLWSAGISYGGRNNGPRMHDLRHTFAVHTFERFIGEGKDASDVVLLISVYMGHKTLKATGHYIRPAAEVYPQMAVRFEESYGHLFPDLGVSNE